MRCRWFVIVFAALLVAPVHAQAPTLPLPRVAIFITSPAEGQAAYAVRLFEESMREVGRVEGKNVVYDRDPPTHHLRKDEEMIDHAAKLIKRSPDLIWLVNTENAVNMHEAQTRNGTQIPVVGASVSENFVLKKGLANSLQRPGKNFTGLLNLGEEVGRKRLEMVQDLIPTLTRVGILVYTAQKGSQTTSAHETSALELKLIQDAAAARRITVVPANVERADQLERAFQDLAKSNVHAVVTTHVPFFANLSKRIVELAAQRRLPVIGHRPIFAEQGAILSYGSSLQAQIRRSAALVDKILKGAKAGDLPLEAFTEWELVANHKTAKAMGLTIPGAVSLRADRHIQ